MGEGLELQGVGTSKGKAIGKGLVYRNQILVERGKCEDPVAECGRLDVALLKAENQIRKVIDELDEKKDPAADIFRAHLMILQDPEFTGGMKSKIESYGMNAEWAVESVANEFIEIFQAMEDPYLRERSSDIRDLAKRVIGVLTNQTRDLGTLLSEQVCERESATESGGTFEKWILIAEDLAPSDTLSLDLELVAGFVTENGGMNSHTGIIARAYGIPAITACKGVLEAVHQGDLLAIDGASGQMIVSPTEREIQAVCAGIEDENRKREQLSKYCHQATESADGARFELFGNIGSKEEAPKAIERGAEGIGLFRTELMFMGRDSMPTEEEQFQEYKAVLQCFQDRLVIIRTLDVGGDKKISYLDIGQEENPFLGYRAIRYCLDHPELFKVQLRALLRASMFGKLGIMLPMVSTLQEVLRTKELLEECKRELATEGLSYSEKLLLGVMIEIPAAAVISDILAQHVDFFSIGTNDLVQYTMAVDRMNGAVANLYSHYDPAVLRLIKLTADSARKHGIFVGVCGEAAADPRFTPFLLGAGIKELSMSAGMIPEIRRNICGMNMEDLRVLAEDLIRKESPEQVNAALDAYFAKS